MRNILKIKRFIFWKVHEAWGPRWAWAARDLLMHSGPRVVQRTGIYLVPRLCEASRQRNLRPNMESANYLDLTGIQLRAPEHSSRILAGRPRAIPGLREQIAQVAYWNFSDP